METEDSINPNESIDIQDLINEENSEDSSDQANSNTTNETNDLYDEIKGKQDEVIAQLRKLSDVVGQIKLTQDDIASIRVEQLSFVYFTRQVRPLVDSLNLIAFASLNVAGTAQIFQTNTFGDRKELRDSLKLAYKMNEEIDEILDALSRRMKIYIRQLDCMDKNCPPFDFREDS